MTFDSLLEQVGANGRYQVVATMFLSLGNFLNALQSLQPIMTGVLLPHSCPINATDGSEPDKGSSSFNLTTTASNTGSEAGVQRAALDSTVASQYGLYCDHQWLGPLVTSLFFLGYLFGCTIYGVISDRFGRQPTLLLGAVNILVCSLGATFAPSYWLHASFRLLAGLGVGGFQVTCFTLLAELLSSRHRVAFFMVSYYTFSMGGMLVALLALLTRSHFWIQIGCATPTLLVLLSPLGLDESPRWLLTHAFDTASSQALPKALRIFKRMAARNRRPHAEPEFRESVLQLLTAQRRREAELEMEHRAKKGDKAAAPVSHPMWRLCPTVHFIVHSRQLSSLLLITWTCCLTICMGYYGSYFAVSGISGNIFVNLFIASAMEIPAHLVALVTNRWWGRRLSIIWSLVAGGCCCLLNTLFVMVWTRWEAIATQLLSRMGQLCFTVAFDTIFYYLGELFPTVIRNVASGTGSTWTRIGSMIAAQISLLGAVWRPAPFFVLGLLPLLSGLSGILLPETRGRHLPDNLHEWKDFVRCNSHIGRNRQKSERQDDEELMMDLFIPNGDKGGDQELQMVTEK